MSGESSTMKRLISYAMIGRVFREGANPRLVKKAHKTDTPKPAKTHIEAEAKANVKKILHSLRMRS